MHTLLTITVCHCGWDCSGSCPSGAALHGCCSCGKRVKGKIVVVAIVTFATLDIAVQQVYALICLKPRIDGPARHRFACSSLTNKKTKTKTKTILSKTKT